MSDSAISVQSSGHRSGRELLRGGAIALAALSLYLSTLAPGLLWGDNGELQRLLWVGGDRSDAHGHPLWFALARLVIRLPVGSIAWRANLFSALSAALAVGVLYLAVASITRRRHAAALAALAFAISHTHWQHAVTAEVYGLFAALLALTLLVFSSWRTTPAASRLPLLGLIAGVTMLSHLLIVTAIPGLLLGVWCCSPAGRRVRNSALFTSGWLVGFGVFVAVSGLEPLRHPMHGGGGPLSILSPPRIKDLFLCIAFAAYQYPISSPLVVWGAVQAWHDDPPIAATLTAVALGDVGFALSFHVPDQYVFYQPAYLVLAIFLAFGVRALGERWRAFGPRSILLGAALVLAPPALYRLAPILASRTHLALVTPRTLPGRDNYEFFMYPPKQGEHSAERFARGSFAVLPESALVIADWAPLEPLRYLREVEHARRDLELVESDPRDTSQISMIAEESLHRPVFIADNEPFPYYDMDGFRQRFDIRSVGPIFQLVRRSPDP